jgi:hypothetical protein
MDCCSKPALVTTLTILHALIRGHGFSGPLIQLTFFLEDVPPAYQQYERPVVCTFPTRLQNLKFRFAK